MKIQTRRAQAGQTLVIFALMSVVLLGFVGIAVDGARGWSTHQSAQAAADSAVLAAADQVFHSGTWAKVDFAIATSTSKNGFSGATVTPSFFDSTGNVVAEPASGRTTSSPTTVTKVSVSIITSQQNYFMRWVANKPTTAIVVSANASTSYGGGGGGGTTTAVSCVVCILNGIGASGALQVQGTPTVTVYGGNTWVNSSSASGASQGGSSHYSDFSSAYGATPTVNGTISVNGGYSGGGFTPTPLTNKGTIADPLYSLAAPAGVPLPTDQFGTQYTSPPSLSLNDNTFVNPGVYRDLQSSGAGATLSMAGGVYVITGQFGNNAALHTCGNCGGGFHGQTGDGCAAAKTCFDASDGVTIYFACPLAAAPWYTACPANSGAGAAGGFTINNQTVLTITAPTTGPTAGIAIYADPNDIVADTFNGGAGSLVNGTIYLPNGGLNLNGNAAGQVFHATVIVNVMTLGGTADFAITGPPIATTATTGGGGGGSGTLPKLV